MKVRIDDQLDVLVFDKSVQIRTTVENWTAIGVKGVLAIEMLAGVLLQVAKSMRDNGQES